MAKEVYYTAARRSTLRSAVLLTKTNGPCLLIFWLDRAPYLQPLSSLSINSRQLTLTRSPRRRGSSFVSTASHFVLEFSRLSFFSRLAVMFPSNPIRLHLDFHDHLPMLRLVKPCSNVKVISFSLLAWLRKLTSHKSLKSG